MKMTEYQKSKVEELFYTKSGKMSVKLEKAINYMKLAVNDSNFKIRVYKQYGSGRFTNYEVYAIYQTINELYKLFVDAKGTLIQNDSKSRKAKSGEYIDNIGFETIISYFNN